MKLHTPLNRDTSNSDNEQELNLTHTTMCSLPSVTWLGNLARRELGPQDGLVSMQPRRRETPCRRRRGCAGPDPRSCRSWAPAGLELQ